VDPRRPLRLVGDFLNQYRESVLDVAGLLSKKALLTSRGDAVSIGSLNGVTPFGTYMQAIY